MANQTPSPRVLMLGGAGAAALLGVGAFLARKRLAGLLPGRRGAPADAQPVTQVAGPDLGGDAPRYQGGDPVVVRAEATADAAALTGLSVTRFSAGGEVRFEGPAPVPVSAVTSRARQTARGDGEWREAEDQSTWSGRAPGA